MKFNFKVGFIISSLCLFNSFVFADDNIQATYKNTRGSVLELDFSKKNRLKGTFTTAVASKECQDVIGKKQPIKGYIDGTALSIMIYYPTCRSIVTLTGHLNPYKNTIDAIAIITHQDSLFNEGPGTEFITSDIFTKEVS